MESMYRKLHKTFFPSLHNAYKPFILRPRNLFILAVILLIIKVLFIPWFFYFPQTSNFAIVTGSRLIELANNERVANGLQALKISDKLIQAAAEKANDMLVNGYFAHTSPSGVTPWFWLDDVKYNYVSAGENLAKDFTDSQFLHQAWMNSPSHKANILNTTYQEIGIAVIEGDVNGKKTLLAVEFFGKESRKTAPKAEVNKENSNVGIAATPKTEATIPAKDENSVKGQDTSITSNSQALPVNVDTKSIENETVLNGITERSGEFVEKTYFIIAGILGLVLLLTIFINIRVQYPRVIFNAVIFIILIAAIALWNVQAVFNNDIDTLNEGASIIRIIEK